MKYLLVALLPLLMTSCASLYPLGGSVVGATGGAAVGGIPGAAIGAGVGWGAGKGAQVVKENKNLKEEVEAYSKGDVEKLVQLRLQEAKEGGFFDSMLEGVYDFIKIVVLVLVLWNVLPLVYTFMSNKKIHKKINGGDNGKTTSDTQVVRQPDEKG